MQVVLDKWMVPSRFYVQLPKCMCTCLQIVCMPAHNSIHTSAHTSTHTSIYMPVLMSTHMSIYKPWVGGYFRLEYGLHCLGLRGICQSYIGRPPHM